MNLKYVKNISGETATMLLYDEIGGDGIKGSDFAANLYQLQNMGVKLINVRINSGGGSVIDAGTIFSAIQKSKVRVDTYNDWVAASSAGWIYLAGKKRFMADNASLMIHPVQTGQSANELKAQDALQNQIITTISNNSKLSQDEVRGMMNATTWLNAEECMNHGLCDEVIQTKRKEKYDPAVAAEANIYAMSNRLTNEFTPNEKQFKSNTKMLDRITNKLELVDGANEDRILGAIDSLFASNKEKASEIASLNNSLKSKDAEIEKLKNDLSKYLKEKADKEATEKAAKEMALKNEAKEYVDALVGAGKIKNDATIIADTMELYFENSTKIKALFDAMPINKTAPKVEEAAKEKVGEKALDGIPTSAMAKMALLKNSLDNRK